MAWLLWAGLALPLAAAPVFSMATTTTCPAPCRCEVETFGLFHSFSLTRVSCPSPRGGPRPVPIPLDTSHLRLRLQGGAGPLGDALLSGPGFTTLVSLDLSSNHITEVSVASLSRLRYLESLDLSHNALQSLPPGCFSGLPLAAVDLSHNHLVGIDLSLFSVPTGSPALTPLHLDLSYNSLSEVVGGGEMGGATRLQSLNLAGNRLTEVPNLRGAPLRDLNLDGNPIKSVGGGAFAGLEDLVSLSLKGLPELLQVQPGAFKGLKSLQGLDLSRNGKLTLLTLTVFDGLASLKELNLEGTEVGGASPPDLILGAGLTGLRSLKWGRGLQCQKRERFDWQAGGGGGAGGAATQGVFKCSEEEEGPL